MRRTVVGIMVVAAVLLVGGAAGAQPDGDAFEQCYGPDGPTLEEAETTKCVKHGDGPWQRVDDSGGFGGLDGEGFGIGFGEIVLFAFVLSLVPGFAGAAVAPSANVSHASGFLIGTFGSWLGVIGLYLYGHSQGRTPRPSGGGPEVEAKRPPSGDAADRLRTLQDLLDQGLISQEEYQARRQAAVDSL
jgi:hypothetical protein